MCANILMYCCEFHNSFSETIAINKMKTLFSFTVIRSISTVPSFSSIQQTNKHLSNLLRSGDITKAQNLLKSIPNPNTTTYNILISFHAKRCELLHARNLFDQIPQKDQVAYNSMLHAYALSNVPEEIEEGRNLFESMVERDFVSWNTMIYAYVRNKRMDDAAALFDKMPISIKNVTIWNIMINGYFSVGGIDKAIELYESMKVRNSASLCVVVSGLVKAGNLDAAEEILLKSGRMIDGAVDAFNTLIAGFARNGMVDEARTLFYLIPNKSKNFEKNVISWNTMIMCYAKSGDLKSARELFDEMPDRDFVSWGTMINGYVQHSKIDEAIKLFNRLKKPDEWSWNAILRGLTSNKDELERARKFFDRIPRKNVVSWNLMIAGYDRNEEYEKASELFVTMQAVGKKPDKFTFSSMLSACAGIARFQFGIQIHQLILKILVPDVQINNALITMYSKCGAFMCAKAVFDEIELTARTVVSWNAIIGGFAYHGFANEALELFEEMKRVKVSPTYITFVLILNACSHAGLVKEGRGFFDSMVHEYGLKPRIEHYASLVNLIGKHGRLEEALEVIKNMLVPPDKAVWGALLNAARIHSNVRMANLAAQELAKIEPEISAPYVTLYNIHANKKKWDDANEARNVMNRCGISKLGGYSWIEIENQVHSFLAGDRTHPLSFEIYSLIESWHVISRDLYITDGTNIL